MNCAIFIACHASASQNNINAWLVSEDWWMLVLHLLRPRHRLHLDWLVAIQQYHPALAVWPTVQIVRPLAAV